MVGLLLAVALVLALVVAALALLLLLRRRREAAPPRAVPDAATPARLDVLLAPRFMGTPADGSGTPADGAVPPAGPTGPPPARVIWVEHGDEVLVHLDSLRTAVAGEAVIVSLDLETDETGRATVVVPFAVGAGPDGGLTLVTEERPRGPAALVGRWGAAIQTAAHAALLDLAEAHAAERGGRPGALFVRDGALHLQARIDG